MGSFFWINVEKALFEKLDSIKLELGELTFAKSEESMKSVEGHIVDIVSLWRTCNCKSANKDIREFFVARKEIQAPISRLRSSIKRGRKEFLEESKNFIESLRSFEDRFDFRSSSNGQT